MATGKTNIHSKEHPQSNFIRTKHRMDAKVFSVTKSHYVRHMSILILFGLLFVGLIQSARFVSAGLNTKSSVLGATTDAIAHLQEAQTLASEKDFTGSEQQFLLAQQNFSDAKSSLNGLGQFVNSSIKLTPQGKSADALLDAGDSITLAGINLTNAYTYGSTIHVTAQGFTAPDGFYETATGTYNYLDKANEYLARAQTDLSNIDTSVLPGEYKDKFSTYQSALSSITDGMQQAADLFSLLKDFIGPTQKTVLVLFENNNELRPTGGFPGTYGLFTFKDGVIINEHISSIYDLDGQMTANIAPPGEMYNLTNHWTLRDSNWFADFGQSAEKANDFYEREGGQTLDAVVAVDPNVFIDLLNITGPIAMPKYNITLTPDNFRDAVQTDTSDTYNKTLNTPKQLLADFAPILLQNISDIAKQSPGQLAQLLLQELSQKNILLYDRDPAIESRFVEYNWAGTILPTDRDYLDIVSANLGGTKTDIQIQNKAVLSSVVGADRTITNTLTYTRTNANNGIENGNNKSYVRFYVPLGSTLVSANGFTSEPFHHSDGSDFPVIAGKPYEVDPDLQNLDQNDVIDKASGTVINTEAGKSVFGNWINTVPGETTTVTLTYTLPFVFTNSKKYSLIVQKQPGATPIDFSYTLEPKGSIEWYTPNSMTFSNGVLNYQGTLDSDLFIGSVFNQ